MRRRLLCLLIGLTMCSLGAVGSDKWLYFYPELVTSYGCKVRDTIITMNGRPTSDVVWQATAFADRDKVRWEMEIGRYPYTLKGRHSAERACMKWQDEAEKRVKAARQ